MPLQYLTNNISRHEFRGPLRDDWVLPSAHYEMAVIAWQEKDLPGANFKAKVLECGDWLDKTANWAEPYALENRMAFKLSTSTATVGRQKRILGI